MRTKALLVLSLLIVAACGCDKPTANPGQPSADAAGNNVQSNVDLPKEMRPEPIEMKEVEPPKVITMEKRDPNAEPTPGIPSPEDMKKPFKPAAKPTPGIPDEKTIKKMLSGDSANVNVRKQ